MPTPVPMTGKGETSHVSIPTNLKEDQPDVSKYHSTSKGTIIPHRDNDFGALPGLDPNGGLGQFEVVDYEDDHVVAVHEKNKRGEEQCPSQQTVTGTPLSPSQALPRREASGSSVKPTQKQLLEELSNSVMLLSRWLETTIQETKDSIQALQSSLQSSLKESVSSLMSDLASRELQTKTTSQSHPRIDDDGWKATFVGSFGSITVSPVVVDLRSEQTVLMLFDPDRPSFVPAKSDDSISIELVRGEYRFDITVFPNGWSSNLLLGEKDYTLVIMSIARDD